MKQRFIILCSVLLLALPAAAQSFEDTLADILDLYVEPGQPGGVIAVNDNGELFTAAIGLADVINETEVATDDLFRIGSITKPMVATVVLSLVESGEIELDAPIAGYLPTEIVENVANADTATVRQVLQMTSGIYNYTESDAFDDATAADPAYGWTAAETVTYAYGEEPYFEPGEGYYYSNTNYNLAEVMIAEVTAQPLSEMLEEVVFGPAGMDSCYLETPDVFARGIIRGYISEEDGSYYDMTEENDGVGLGDGGVVCTAADLAKFMPALAEGELIGEEMLAEMFDYVEDDMGETYGLGIDYIEDEEFGLLLAHGGTTSGFNGYAMYLVEEGISVAVLTNQFDSEYPIEAAIDATYALFDEG